MIAIKSAIEGRVTEITEDYAVVRDGDATQVYSLSWYRVGNETRSLVELRKPDGDGGDAA